MVEPYPTPTQAVTARHTHQENNKFAFLTEKPVCVTPQLPFSVEQCPREHVSQWVNASTVRTQAHGFNTNPHARTQTYTAGESTAH